MLRLLSGYRKEGQNANSKCVIFILYFYLTVHKKGKCGKHRNENVNELKWSLFVNRSMN